MLQHQVQSFPPLPAPVAAGLGDGLLDGIGPLAGARALVLGHGALEAICALIRAGCTAATELPICERRAPDPDSADIAIVPEVGSLAEARTAIARAGRALAMGGQIVVGDTTGRLAPQIAALLRTQGFCTVRARATRAGQTITAERPIFGPLPCG